MYCNELSFFVIGSIRKNVLRMCSDRNYILNTLVMTTTCKYSVMRQFFMIGYGALIVIFFCMHDSMSKRTLKFASSFKAYIF